MADAKTIEIVPGEDVPAAPPYATSAFISVQGGVDATIIFLRGPVMLPDALEAAKKTGKVVGTTVASVTLPLGAARRLGEFLVKTVAASEEAAK
jgi:hypothetical protein